MKKHDEICGSELISRYYDRELGPEEYAEVESHVESCLRCRESLEKFSLITKDIKSEIKISENQYLELQDRVIESIDHKKLPFWIKLKEMLSPKKILIPAGAMVTLLAALVIFFHTPAANGPTAIITSLSGNSSSVMILETPETRQTIILFSEKG